MEFFRQFKFTALSKLYMQIAGMLTLSTGAVLLCMVGAYWALTIQLRQYNATLLEGERQEVQLLLQSFLAHPGQRREESLLDDSGQHIAFAVFDDHQLALESDSPQIPSDVLQRRLAGPTWQEFTFSDQPFRLYHYAWRFGGKTYDIAIYQMTAREHHMMHQARNVLFIAGLAGATMAAVFNMKFAQFALASLRKNWETQREWLLELSHELQTPLAVARAGMFAKDTEPGRVLAVQAIEDASSLVRDIVYLSKLSTLPDSSPTEPVPVSEVTEEAIDRLLPLAKYRKINITGSAQPGLFVATTTDRWSRLVSLVVKNGIDHGAEGTLLSWSLHRDGWKVIFVVQNRSASPLQSSRSGSRIKRGVGLLIVDRLVQEMRGTFEILEEEGNTVARTVVPLLRSKRI